jgi:hypothetical protein
MWKCGFEIELMAPKGRTRQELAQRVAARIGGQVEKFFHQQSEPSKVVGMPVFHNLGPGFRVVDGNGRWYADFVDDLTLKAGLDADAPSLPGWYRIVSDDVRFLQLVIRQCSPLAPQHRVLEPIAALFGTQLERNASGMCKVVDGRKAAITIVSGLPGERERPCEIVTAPLENERKAVLQLLTEEALALGFTVPLESATHIHFDGRRLCSAGAMSNVIRLFRMHGNALKERCHTNPACVRLGPWPKAIMRVVERPGFSNLPWTQAVEALLEAKTVKYCDFNIQNLLVPIGDKVTFEVRILPTQLEPAKVLEKAQEFEMLLNWCADASAPGRRIPDSLTALFAGIEGPATP